MSPDPTGWEAPPNDDPVSRIVWLPADHLAPNTWNPNHVAPAEMDLLARSILLTGWVQPVLAAPWPDGPAELMVVDGFHRWVLAQQHPEVRARWGGRLPVAVLDLDRPSAMLLTVRINRAKGTHASTDMARLVQALDSAGVPHERIRDEMGATQAEVDLLLTPNVFKARKIEEHRYSRAWRPVEDGRSSAQSPDDKARAAATARKVSTRSRPH